MSGAPLDMTLDDLIKSNKKSNPRGRGDRAAAGPSLSCRGPNRFANCATPYAPPRAPESAWAHEMFPGGGGGRSGGGSWASSIETGTKLYMSNLDYGVSTEDIKELFSEVGDMKRVMVHYDRSGRSKGTAEVVFSRRNDPASAVKRYNNVQLDGKPMKIELVATNIKTPAAGLPPAGAFGDSNLAPRRCGTAEVVFSRRNDPASVVKRYNNVQLDGKPMKIELVATNITTPAAGLPPAGAFGDSNLAPQSGPARGGFGGFGRPRGGGPGRGSGRGRGRGRGQGEKVYADDLDVDLEKYHAEAMQTNC